MGTGVVGGVRWSVVGGLKGPRVPGTRLLIRRLRGSPVTHDTAGRQDFSIEPFAKFGKRLVYWPWFWKSSAFGDVAADSVRGLPPGRVVPPGSAGVPPASVRAQPGRSALPSIHAKGADSPHSPWGRAPRNGKSGAQSEAVAVARILFAEKRCGRDARAPGWASPP